MRMKTHSVGLDQHIELQEIPVFVTEALVAWHKLAIHVAPTASAESESSRSAVAAWKEFENACIQWQRAGHAVVEQRIARGPTGTH
jgi:hypothetical protein